MRALRRGTHSRSDHRILAIQWVVSLAMFAAAALLTVGVVLVWSAVKGLSVTDIFAGVTGEPIDPKGGVQPGSGEGGPGTGPSGEHDPKGDYRGPRAGWLRAMEDAATGRFNLKITDRCRPQNAPYGARNSRHKQCRALDAAGAPADMLAFARYAHAQLPTGGHVFYDPAGWSAPGYEHTSHVHVDA